MNRPPLRLHADHLAGPLPAGAVIVKPWRGEVVAIGCAVWTDLAGVDWVIYAPATLQLLVNAF